MTEKYGKMEFCRAGDIRRRAEAGYKAFPQITQKRNADFLVINN